MATFFDVIDRPKKAFIHVVEHPKSLWTPLILIIIGLIVLAVVNLQSSATAASNRFAQFANITPGSSSAAGQQAGATGASGSGTSGFRQRTGQAASAGQTPQPGQTGQAATLGTQSTLASNGILTPIMGIILLIISWLLIGTLGHFLGKLFGGVSHFVATFAVGVWTTLPFFFRDLTQLAFQLITTRTIIYQGLSFLAPVGRNVSASSRILSTLVASIDPFAIWFLVLLGIGIAVATKVKGWKAVLIAVLIFAVLVGVRLLPTLLNLAIRVPILG
jgi:hypothetical protein